MQSEEAESVSCQYKSPTMKTRGEKMLFEKSREECELQLSRENISELKTESEYSSEQEALNDRILKWQQGVQIEQELTVELPPDWVEASPYEDTVNQSTDIQTTNQPTTQQPIGTSLEKRTKEISTLGDAEPTGLQMKQDETILEVLATEGRETRLQRDSEYFVSEEEALAQRLLNWQQDVLDQEEVVELEPEWSMGEQHNKQRES